MDKDDVVRKQLLALLGGGNAHIGFDRVVTEFPLERINSRLPNIPYSAWELLEHLRIAQWDILEFIRNPDHVSPKWPEGYWPENEGPSDDSTWTKSVEQFQEDLLEMQSLVANPDTDLFEKIPHGKGQNILREALLLADHNAYHVGQLVLLRKIMGAW